MSEILSVLIAAIALIVLVAAGMELLPRRLPSWLALAISLVAAGVIMRCLLGLLGWR